MRQNLAVLAAPCLAKVALTGGTAEDECVAAFSIEMSQRVLTSCRCCRVPSGQCRALQSLHSTVHCTAGSAGSSFCAGKSRGLLKSRHSAPVLVAEGSAPAGSPAPAAAASKVPGDAEASGVEPQPLAHQSAAPERGAAKTSLPAVAPLPATSECAGSCPQAAPSRHVRHGQALDAASAAVLHGGASLAALAALLGGSCRVCASPADCSSMSAFSAAAQVLTELSCAGDAAGKGEGAQAASAATRVAGPEAVPAQGESTRHTGPLPASRQVDANDPQLHGLKTIVAKTDKVDAADKGPPGESAF